MDKNDYNLSCGSTEHMSISEIKKAAIADLKMMQNAPADVPIDQSFIQEMRRLQALVTHLTELERQENEKQGV